MKRITAVLLLCAVAMLAGCGSPGLHPDSLSKTNASTACFTGPGWNGGQVHVMYVNADKGVSGTAGGSLTIVCGSATATFTDGGKAIAGRVTGSATHGTTPATSTAPASIDVPVRVNPVIQ